jgi:hypothetical protein
MRDALRFLLLYAPLPIRLAAHAGKARFNWDV